jgi:hypothetical protein
LLIFPLNTARDVYRISQRSDTLLQAASHHANDHFAEMCAHANSERALEQSLHIRLYIPFDGMEHIKAGPHRLEGRAF